MNIKKGALIILLLIILIGGSASLFTVDETQTTIVTQFGKYIQSATEPGLYFKIPFVQVVHYFDKRILEYDAAPSEILTKDKKNLVLDNYSRWKIIDPLKFFKTVRSEAGAQARLDDIVFANLREELARHNLSEIIDVRREAIMEVVHEKSEEKARQYGIKVIDVRIKRADLPREVEESVFARMRAERERIAKKYRSEGEEQAAKLRAGTDKDRVIILADAYKEAQKTRGEGDAEAVKIYANAFQKDPKFYDFLRTLETYKKTIDEETTLVLGSDSELLRYINKIK
ncbi:MAG TPA: protease modulator HflC [Nitrospinota bacterium]|nr:protease modulator HflC [Nitrospinota bacterium]